MCKAIRHSFLPISVAAIAVLLVASTALAQDAATAGWQVSKSSGDVWVTALGVQPASLGSEAILKPGDFIRTGRNGRVLLKRGDETILIAPNSVIGVPAPQTQGSSTTIIQQAGSILLDVEKRSDRNFEVETPYLVAAVKGTQFQVSVSAGDASVNVVRGAVEVADVKSGQIALVHPGQTAKVAALGRGGLSLSGAGTLSPIRQGAPRATSVTRVPVPRGGLTAPRGAQGQNVRAIGNANGRAVTSDLARGRANGVSGMRIGVALGEVKLDIRKVTNGLARKSSASANGRAGKQTVWSSGDITPGNGVGKTYNAGNNGSGNGAGGANGNAGGNGNGNGNAGGVGNSNAGGNGNGNAYELANGNNGNGKGKGKGKS